MKIGRSLYLSQRETLWQACTTASSDPARQAALLTTWPDLPPGIAGTMLVGLDPPADADRLVAWFTGPVPDDGQGPRARAAWDLAVLAGAVPRPASSAERTAAALAWLVRMGDEVQRREHDAWRLAAPGPHPDDATVTALWARLLGGTLDPRTITQVAALLRPATEQAFHAVGRSLGLPAATREQVTRDAVEALQDVAFGAHLDLAARAIEAAGEPLSMLAEALPSEGWHTVRRCVARREGWRDLADAPLGPDDVSGAAARLTMGRLIEHVQHGPLSTSASDLPGWSVVRANRAKLRGRLRATLRDHPDALLTALMSHPGIAPRTRLAARRWAWDWAWRQARTGFAFSWDGSLAPACQLPEEPEPLAPLGPAQDRAIVTWLLTMLGRGCWDELERWLAGAPGRSLSTTFYRYLATAPDTLADIPGTEGRARTYRRLQDHLSDGGLEAYVPALRATAHQLRRLDTGRGLRERLEDALRPHWDAAQPLPEHHMSTFVQRCVAFLGS